MKLLIFAKSSTIVYAMNGSSIKRLRKQLALTQAELGQLLDAHGVTVSRWENEITPPTPYQSALLSEFQKAAKSKGIGRSVKNLLAGAGTISAVFLLLETARSG